eukprot:TRINITY_DN31824_c0_g1_i2.p1 TRINITY_DN31824_c0_g1~~TRINITY_DN31824_c0_g1_i2.p1  ORF type:complete len:486 (+),score=122.44 TRINITY_DN31824_c0_g1_i2:64-1521(+)
MSGVPQEAARAAARQGAARAVVMPRALRNPSQRRTAEPDWWAVPTKEECAAERAKADRELLDWVTYGGQPGGAGLTSAEGERLCETPMHATDAERLVQDALRERRPPPTTALVRAMQALARTVGGGPGAVVGPRAKVAGTVVDWLSDDNGARLRQREVSTQQLCWVAASAATMRQAVGHEAAALLVKLCAEVVCGDAEHMHLWRGSGVQLLLSALRRMRCFSYDKHRYVRELVAHAAGLPLAALRWADAAGAARSAHELGAPADLVGELILSALHHDVPADGLLTLCWMVYNCPALRGGSAARAIVDRAAILCKQWPLPIRSDQACRMAHFLSRIGDEEGAGRLRVQCIARLLRTAAAWYCSRIEADDPDPDAEVVEWLARICFVASHTRLVCSATAPTIGDVAGTLAAAGDVAAAAAAPRKFIWAKLLHALASACRMEALDPELGARCALPCGLPAPPITPPGPSGVRCSSAGRGCQRVSWTAR